MVQKLRSRPELWIVFGVLVIHVIWFKTLLEGRTTFAHDNQIWGFPVFIHYFRHLSEGSIPVFNFFSRFGEPFVPPAAQMRLWDPIESLLGVFIWDAASSKIQAYNLFRYLIGLLQSIGAYLFFRTYTHLLWVRFVLLVTCLFSSFYLGSFVQDGILNQFLWMPWTLWLVRERFIKRAATMLDCWALGFLIGNSFQSYFFIIPSLFLVFYFVFNWLSGVRIASFDSARLVARRSAMVMLPLAFMGVLNLVTLKSSRDWTFPARTTPFSEAWIHIFDPDRHVRALEGGESLRLDSEKVKFQGTSSNMTDYVQLFGMYGNYQISTKKQYFFGEASEAFLYFGWIPLLIGAFGFARVRSAEDLLWLNLLCIFFILSLDAKLGVYSFLVKIIPVLGFIRHTHVLAVYVQFCFLYFIVNGGNSLHQVYLGRVAKTHS